MESVVCEAERRGEGVIINQKKGFFPVRVI
jgi:hypothetical protein